jgi:hypothetical protein
MRARLTRRLLIGIAAGACLFAAPPAASGQSAPPDPPPAQTSASSQSAAQLDRIRAALDREPLRLESNVRFYLQVTAPTPTFADFVKGKDLRYAPVAGAGMTHGEFLGMVTPKELYSAAGIRPAEALGMAITGLVGRILMKKAFESVTDMWRARELREINERIDAELAALRGKDK